MQHLRRTIPVQMSARQTRLQTANDNGMKCLFSSAALNCSLTVTSYVVTIYVCLQGGKSDAGISFSKFGELFQFSRPVLLCQLLFHQFCVVLLCSTEIHWCLFRRRVTVVWRNRLWVVNVNRNRLRKRSDCAQISCWV